MDEAAKRKRVSDPEGQPDAKRPAAAAAATIGEQSNASADPRAALAEVYAAYDALHRSNYTSQDDIKANEAHFAVLLSSSVQGDEAVRRLAIRLLAKFAPRFPSLISDAAVALQGMSSLNLNTNDTETTTTENGGVEVPIESLEGLKRMLLATTTATSSHNNNNNNGISAAAEGALHFAFQQHLHPTITEERRDILNSIAKAAFIASPPAVLTQILEISQNGTTTALRPLVLKFIESHLLVKVHEQEVDIKDCLLSVENEKYDGSVEEEEAQMLVLLAALKNKREKNSEIDHQNDDGGKVVVSALQSLHQHCSSVDASSTLLDGLKAVLDALSPRLPSPPAADAGAGGGASKKRRSTGSLSPKPDAYYTRRGYNGTKNTPPLPPSGSSRPPRTSPRDLRGTTAAAAQLPPRTSKWSSRGPTPTLEEGELGEIDEGELPPPQHHQSTALRRSRSPAGGRGERGDRERGRRRGSPSPFAPPPSSSSYRDRRDDRREDREYRSERSERDRGDRGDYRGGGDRGAPLPPRGNQPSNQKVSGRGMPPLEYAGKALWVGQVPLGHSAERDLVDAFSRFGPLTSHKIIARSSCAFFNYVDVESAIQARERLDGARVAGSTLVVEFKGEKKYWESREGRERDRERERGEDRRGEDRGGGEYNRDRGEYRDTRDQRGGGGSEYARQSPFTGGPPPFPSSRRGRGSRSRSRSRSPRGGGRSRRQSFGDGGGGSGAPEGGVWQNQPGRLYSTMSQEQIPSLQPSLSQQLPPVAAPAPAPTAAAGGGSILWQGSLGKSRQPQAEVACLSNQLSSSSNPSGSWSAVEPAAWPAMLDVQNRISTAYVLNTLLPMLPPAERAVLRLIPAPGRESTESARLHAFSSYLQGKQRTGVVELGPGPQPGAPRQWVLYLIPASDEACRAVGQMSRGNEEFMFAVVAPKSDEPGGN